MAIMELRRKDWFVPREKSMWYRMAMWFCSALMYKKREDSKNGWC